MNCDVIFKEIDLVENITNSLYENLLNMNSKEFYSNIGCLEFAKIISTLHQDSEYYIKNDMHNCAILVEGILYDINGIIYDSNNYHKASLEELKYLNNIFKPFHIAENVLIKIFKEELEKFSHKKGR